MRLAKILACLGVSLATAGWIPTSQAQKQTKTTLAQAEPTRPSQAAASQTNGAAVKPMARRDRRYMEILARANLAEIETGKLAEAKGSEPVQTLGIHMIEDHTKAMRTLQELADRHRVRLPTAPDEIQRKLIKQLKKWSGDDFDREYLRRAGVAAHKSSLRLIKKIQRTARNEDLIDLAGEMQAAVERHLQMSKDMLKSEIALTKARASDR